MAVSISSVCFLRLFLGAGGFGVLGGMLLRKSCGEKECPEGIVLPFQALGAAVFRFSGCFYGFPERITVQELLVSGFLAALFGAALMDAGQKKISSVFPAVILLLGLAGLFFFPEYGIGKRLLGLLAGTLPPLLLYCLAPGALGGGDVKLLGASGWFLGAGSVLAGMAAAFLMCGLFAAFSCVYGRAGRKTALALGPFLAAGLALAAFRGEALTAWYLYG